MDPNPTTQIVLHASKRKAEEETEGHRDKRNCYTVFSGVVQMLTLMPLIAVSCLRSLVARTFLTTVLCPNSQSNPDLNKTASFSVNGSTVRIAVYIAN